MPKELEDQLMELDWPPTLSVGAGDGKTQEIKLTELDINWVFCSLLGMKWSDAKAVDDPLERRFLYNTAMDIAHAQDTHRSELEEQRNRMEEKIDTQLADITKQFGGGGPPKL